MIDTILSFEPSTSGEHRLAHRMYSQAVLKALRPFIFNVDHLSEGLPFAQPKSADRVIFYRVLDSYRTAQYASFEQKVRADFAEHNLPSFESQLLGEMKHDGEGEIHWFLYFELAASMPFVDRRQSDLTDTEFNHLYLHPMLNAEMHNAASVVGRIDGSSITELAVKYILVEAKRVMVSIKVRVARQFKNILEEFAFPDFVGKILADDQCEQVVFRNVGHVRLLTTTQNNLVVYEVEDTEHTIIASKPVLDVFILNPHWRETYTGSIYEENEQLESFLRIKQLEADVERLNHQLSRSNRRQSGTASAQQSRILTDTSSHRIIECLKMANTEFKCCNDCYINFNVIWRGVTEDADAGHLAMECAKCGTEKVSWAV